MPAPPHLPRRWLRHMGLAGALAVLGWSGIALGQAGRDTSRDGGCAASPTRRVQELPGSPGDVVAGAWPVLVGGLRGTRATPALIVRTPSGLAAKIYFMVARRGPGVIEVTGHRVGRPPERVRFLDTRSRRPTIRLVLRRGDVAANGTRHGPRYLYQPNGMTVPRAGCYRLTARWGADGRISVVVVSLPAPSPPPARSR